MSSILMLYVHKALKMAIIKHAQVNMGYNERAMPLVSPTHVLLSSSKFSANWRTTATYIVCKDGC